MTDRLAYKPAEVAELVGLSKETVMRAIHAGKLQAKRNGGRYLVTRKQVDEWLDGLEDAV